MIGLVFRIIRVSFSDVFFQWFCTVQGFGNMPLGVGAQIALVAPLLDYWRGTCPGCPPPRVYAYGAGDPERVGAIL